MQFIFNQNLISLSKVCTFTFLFLSTPLFATGYLSLIRSHQLTRKIKWTLFPGIFFLFSGLSSATLHDFLLCEGNMIICLGLILFYLALALLAILTILSEYSDEEKNV